jgi:hypothetical protein
MSTGEHRFPFAGCAWAIGAILLLVLGLVAWTSSGLLSVPLCQNDIRHEVLSPDKRLKMVVFCRDCGATTGFNSQGSIIGAGEHLPDEAGTIFITDKDEATVSWIEPDRVVVTFKGTGPDFKLEKQFQGITIDYR